MFLIVPGAVLGLVSVPFPTAARTMTTVLAPVLVIGAGVWLGRHEAPTTRTARRSGAQLVVLGTLVGLFLVMLLLIKLYSH
jgi:hypothetical protein